MHGSVSLEREISLKTVFHQGQLRRCPVRAECLIVSASGPRSAVISTFIRDRYFPSFLKQASVISGVGNYSFKFVQGVGLSLRYWDA